MAGPGSSSRSSEGETAAGPSAAAPLPFEKALEQLQLAVRRLESGELPLEEALKGFEDGVKLARLCQEQLSAAEQRVELLVQAAEGRVETQPFTGGSSEGPVGPRQG